MFILSTTMSAQNKVLHAGETDWPISITENSSQSVFKSSQIMSCAANTIITTGYPAWTNYWAGYMFRVINTSTCSIIVNCFEARFQGTSGYRIYTKTGTFIGFELLSGSWTLVGTANNVTGISTVTGTPIPIVVGVTIPAGASQSFYLTRTDNLVANRHLYNTGTGTAGTTIYASDANVQITEAEYIDPFFAALQIGTRRPSFDMYYDKVCGVLPIELISFEGNYEGSFNSLRWITATELNNDYFIVERSEDGLNWTEIGKISGSGTSHGKKMYSFKDFGFRNTLNYYRLSQVDYNGESKKSGLIVIDNKKEPHVVVKTTNIFGQDVSENFEGLKIIFYSDGFVQKKID